MTAGTPGPIPLYRHTTDGGAEYLAAGVRSVVQVTKLSKSERKTHALERLRELVKPGDRLYSILRHVSRSGMSRTISLYIFDSRIINDKGYPVWLDGYISIAGISRFKESRAHPGGLVVGGCGFNQAQHLADSLAWALWQDDKKRLTTEAL